jgi:hypothetical protein
MTVPTHSFQPAEVETEFWFLQRADHHQEEKPYKLRYDPGDEIQRTNCTNESVDGIKVYNIRGGEHEFTIEKEGFAVVQLESKLTPEEFYDDDKVKMVYYEELKELLKNRSGATRVEVLEHGVRYNYMTSGLGNS